MKNPERADVAKVAMDAFAPEVMGDRSFDELVEQGVEGDGPDCIADLICDLMHLANKLGWDADKLVKRGIGNYEFEIENECKTCGETDGCDCAG